MNLFDEYWLLREVGTGVIAMLKAIIAYALGVFIYDHRVSLTVEDKEARNAAIGLVIIFGALAVRAADLWLMMVATRLEWTVIEVWTGSPVLYLCVLVGVLIGVMLTVKAFHPWPIWAVMLAVAVGVPVAVSFL